MPRKVNNFDDMDGSKWFSFIYFYVDITKLSSKDKEFHLPPFQHYMVCLNTSLLLGDLVEVLILVTDCFNVF